MADIQMISTSTLIASIIGSILGSGVISAVVSGLFNNSSKDNEWRSQQLSLDKQELRKLLLDLQLGKLLLDYNSYEFDVYAEDISIESDSRYLKIIAEITAYLDSYNKFSLQILNNYNDIKKESILIHKICFNYDFSTLEEYHPENPKQGNDLLGAAIYKHLELKQNHSLLVQQYFSEYYPKSSIWLRICKCLCS